MSSDPKSLSSGISLPQWMKNKLNDHRFDLDENSFSPPSHDDSFFYIRYPNTTKTEERKDGYQNINDVLRNNQQTSTSSAATSSAVDFSKHTKPCQKFIQGVPAMPPQKSIEGAVKSNGTDDGFKNAACGSSILKVAQSIIGSQQTPTKPLARGNSSPRFDESTGSDIEEAAATFDFSKRRGSRSLPASPMGSPKAQRRAAGNPFFTGTFVVEKPNTTEGSGRGWLLSTLLSQRSQYSSQLAIDEADEALDLADDQKKENIKLEKTSITKSVENINLFNEETDKKSKSFKAKPSEFREMNFWSPTSM